MPVNWEKIKQTPISISMLVSLATHLKSKDGKNREYDRGLVELIVEAIGSPQSKYKAEVAEMVGVRSEAVNACEEA